jgi:hypothetical protein
MRRLQSLTNGRRSLSQKVFVSASVAAVGGLRVEVFGVSPLSGGNSFCHMRRNLCVRRSLSPQMVSD